METLGAISLLSLLLLTLSFPPPPSSAAPSPPTTAYDALRSHGLPAGLFPKGVRDFKIDGEGRFEARLDSPCTAKFESEVQYAANVSGVLSYAEIAAISGVSAQELFLWFPVHGIRVDVPSSGLIYFDVGVVHKQFSLSLFDSPRDCEPLALAAGLHQSKIASFTDNNHSERIVA